MGRADLALVLLPRRVEEAHEAGIVHRLDRRGPPLRRFDDLETLVVDQRRANQLGAAAGSRTGAWNADDSSSCSGSWRRCFGESSARTATSREQQVVVEVLLLALRPLQLARRRLRQRARSARA